MNYQAALQYLYGLTDYETERIARYDPQTLDLSRVERVLARIGSPHNRFPSLHIAGTKGKGSVAAMCASVLQAAGLRTGLYTSPHLHSFRERIRVDGELIPQGELIALVSECRPIFDTEPTLTTFEAVTALAFLYFVRRQVDFAVVEVGLGGRLDATNVITPQLAVITSISFDHTYLLGHTLADIAREKAGIVKSGVPTVCAPQHAEALTAIQDVCDARRSPLTLVGRDWSWQRLASPPGRLGTQGQPLRGAAQTFVASCSQGTSELQGTYTIPFFGEHQVTNAVTAIAALDLLRRNGTPLNSRQLHQGLAHVRWPGRFEILRPEPPLIVDCAHNGDSMAKLVAALEEWDPGREWTFIIGVSQDKDLAAMLRALAPLTKRLIVTQSSHARAMPSPEVAALAAQILPQAGAPLAEVEVTGDVAEALDSALNGVDAVNAPSLRGAGDPICATGSIFVVADVREVWALYTGRDLPEADVPTAHRLLLLEQDK